jgi:hypothetical protein
MEKVTIGMIDGSVHVFSVPDAVALLDAAERAVENHGSLRVADLALLPADMIVYVRRGKM